MAADRYQPFIAAYGTVDEQLRYAIFAEMTHVTNCDISRTRWWDCSACTTPWTTSRSQLSFSLLYILED